MGVYVSCVDERVSSKQQVYRRRKTRVTLGVIVDIFETYVGMEIMTETELS
jgi:hypothetical protein